MNDNGPDLGNEEEEEEKASEPKNVEFIRSVSPSDNEKDFHPIKEKEFMRIKDLKIILYTNLVSYFIVFRIFISTLSFVCSSLQFIILLPFLLFDLSGFYGARKLSLSVNVAYTMYLIIDLITKAAGIVYFVINLALVDEEDLYTFYLKILVISILFLVFGVGQIYLQIKFCQKITTLSPEKTFILERVIRGKTFPFCICCEVPEEDRID